MAVTHPTAVRDAVCNLVVDLLDAESPTVGNIILQTSGSVEVATLPLTDGAFGDSASGVATANAITSDTSATGGTIAKFVFQDGAGSPLPVFYGAIALSASDMNSPGGLILGEGDTVGITAFTYEAMP